MTSAYNKSPKSNALQLERGIQAYTQFYTGEHSGRKLSWLPHLSRVDLKASFQGRRYELSVTIPQCSLLLAFNEQSEWSMEALGKRASVIDVQKILEPLVDMKILCVDKSGVIVLLNDAFSAKKTKIKVPQSSLPVNGIEMTGAMSKDDVADRQALQASVLEDRKLLLQASLVRIMKSRKTLDHTSLIGEVLAMTKTRFQPSVQLIKRVIESLIDKGYLSRSEDDRDVYLYLS